MGRSASAGLLLYRTRRGVLEVMLVHPGGPFFARRDAGAWSIPKGELVSSEDAFAAARREFEEETGLLAPSGEAIDLGVLRQRSGKLVNAWALEADVEVDHIESNSFELEWPPRSGRRQSFPEVDRAAWFDLDTARDKLVKGQLGFLEALTRARTAGSRGA